MKKRKNYSRRKKRHQRKIEILSICLIILIILLNPTVKAGIQDSTLRKNRIEGIYAVAPLNDKTHLYYLQQYTLNDNIAYCIELGKDITTDIYNSTTDIKEQEKLTNLNKDQLEYIKAIAYFGYGYPEHNNKEYYMAAQELIWEYLSKIDITWTNQLDINGPKINIDTYKNEISNLANNYITSLSLPQNVLYSINSTYTLTENNNNLSFYNVTSKNNQQVTISGNQLEIKIGTKYMSKDTITLTRKNNYNSPATIYNFENSQVMLSTGNLSNKKYEINVKIVGADLKVELIDKDTNKYTPSGQASLIDPIYELYDNSNNLITTFPIPYPGFTLFTNLSFGTYYIKHKQPSKGYQLSKDVTKVEINSLSNRIIVSEEVIKNSIEINKLYEFENGNIREPNITFEIYDNKNALYKSITTTKNGPDIVTLPYGEYTIKQLNTSYGYEKVEDIKVNIDNQSNTSITYDLLDKKIKSLVHIKTIDETTNEKILDNTIKYKIKNKETNEYITYKNEHNEPITEFSTNESGELTLPVKLAYGEYSLEQTTPPKNYVESKEILTLIINEKTDYSYIDNQIMVNINFENEPIIGNLNIITKEEIIRKQNSFEKEEIIRKNKEIEIYQNNQLLKTYQTNEEGMLIIDNIKLGNYCIKDKEIEEEKCIEIKNKDNQTKIVKMNVVFIKKMKTTEVTIKNIDNENNPIEGTVIELYNQDKLITTSMTNEVGIIRISEMIKGKYCIKETKINSNYLINQEKQCFNVNEEPSEQTIIIINKQNKKIENPKTLDDVSFYLSTLIFSTLALTIIVLKIIIKKK